MVSVKGTKQTLALLVVVLLVISLSLKIAFSVPPWRAFVDTIVTIFEINYYGLTPAQTGIPAVFFSKLIDTAIPPLLTFLLITMFVDAINGLNIRERFARSKIAKMKGHIIITPFNGLSETLAKQLKNSEIHAVLIARTQKELDEIFENGLIGISGDIDSPEILLAAGIPNAFCIVSCSDDDSENALIALTVKSKHPKAKIISIVNKNENADKMKSIGVEYTTMPDPAAGTEIGNKIVKIVYTTTKLKE